MEGHLGRREDGKGLRGFQDGVAGACMLRVLVEDGGRNQNVLSWNIAGQPGVSVAQLRCATPRQWFAVHASDLLYTSVACRTPQPATWLVWDAVGM